MKFALFFVIFFVNIASHILSAGVEDMAMVIAHAFSRVSDRLIPHYNFLAQNLTSNVRESSRGIIYVGSVDSISYQITSVQIVGRDEIGMRRVEFNKFLYVRTVPI